MQYFPSEGRLDKMFFPYYGKKSHVSKYCMLSTYSEIFLCSKKKNLIYFYFSIYAGKCQSNFNVNGFPLTLTILLFLKRQSLLNIQGMNTRIVFDTGC